MTQSIRRLTLAGPVATLLVVLLTMAYVLLGSTASPDNSAARTACRATFIYYPGTNIVMRVIPWHPPLICYPY